MGLIPVIKVWTFEELTSTDLNSALATIRDTVNATGLFTDVNRTVTGTLTFTTSPVFSGNIAVGGTLTSTGAFTASAGVTVTTGGVTVTAGGITVTAGGVTITLGGLTVVAGGATITGNSTITGNLTVSGTLTASAVIGTPSIAAANVTAGTFPSGSWAFGTRLVIPASGNIRSTDGVFRGASLDFGSVSGTIALPGSGNFEYDQIALYATAAVTLPLDGTLDANIVGHRFRVVIRREGGGTQYAVTLTRGGSGIAWATGSQPAHSLTPETYSVYVFEAVRRNSSNQFDLVGWLEQDAIPFS